MDNNDLDPRVRRTRQFIHDALIQLTDEKGFHAITVRDLTRKADINRSTFYQHYKDKYDLLDKCMDEVLLPLLTTVAPTSRDEMFMVGEDPNPAYVRLFEYILENARFFQVMLGKNAVPSFQHRMLKVIRSLLCESIEKLQSHPDKHNVPKEFVIHYVSSANLGIISFWLENDMIYSPKYMAKQLSCLTAKGPVNAVGL